MNHDFDDIRGKIIEPPIWFDENAVPRYCNFSPDVVANIYADEAVLAEITCQGCGKLFHVAFSLDRMQKFKNNQVRLSDNIRQKELHYGDPPNIGCCAAGPTMNSEPRRVLEYWSRHHKEYVGENNTTIKNVEAYMKWIRDHSLEIDIKPDWVE